MPEQYGSWQTAHERLRRWTVDGTWQKILAGAVVKDGAVEAIAVDGARQLPAAEGLVVIPGTGVTEDEDREDDQPDAPQDVADEVA